MGKSQSDFSKIILVTGGSGFIGSNYLNWAVLRYPNYCFINLDALTYAANQKNIEVADQPNYIFIHADIRDQAALETIWNEYHPTHIINFAAESHVDNSITGPSIFVETNILGTQNLLEIARRHAVKRFHQISTDEVYGSLDTDDRPSREEDLLEPNSPYSASKAAAEMLVRAYNKTFGLNTVTTRASNNYGPYQHGEKLIPLFITNLLQKKKVPLYGTGKNVRDWLYVGDHVQGIDRVFHDGRSGEIYNLGGGYELENIDITKKLLTLLQLDETMINYVTDRPGHDFRYALDSSKAEKKLGWKPEKSFDEGLHETIQFYKKELGVHEN